LFFAFSIASFSFSSSSSVQIVVLHRLFFSMYVCIVYAWHIFVQFTTNFQLFVYYYY
jgi:hypothetical protein